jgi:hypothetical protein
MGLRIGSRSVLLQLEEGMGMQTRGGIEIPVELFEAALWGAWAVAVCSD